MTNRSVIYRLHPPEGAPAEVFGLIQTDGYARFFRALIMSGTGLVILHGLVFRGMEDSTRNEFVPMLLGTALGGSLLVSTDHLVMLLLSLELLSLNSYLLAGWQRKERRSSAAAASLSQVKSPTPTAASCFWTSCPSSSRDPWKPCASRCRPGTSPSRGLGPAAVPHGSPG